MAQIPCDSRSFLQWSDRGVGAQRIIDEQQIQKRDGLPKQIVPQNSHDLLTVAQHIDKAILDALPDPVGVDMPIVSGVNAVVTGQMTPAQMGLALMTRDKTSEVNQSEMNVRFESAMARRRMQCETRRVLVAGTFPMLTAEEIAWLKAAKERGTWLAVALVNDGDADKFEERRESLRALRCVDRVVPVRDWADLTDTVWNLRIDLVAARPEQAARFADQPGLNVEVVTL